MKRINHLIQKLACSASKAAPLAIVVAGLFATSPIALAQQCSFTGFPTVYANPGQHFSSAGTLSISGIYGPTLLNVGYNQNGSNFAIQSLNVSTLVNWPTLGQVFLSSSQQVTVSGMVPLTAKPLQVAQVTFNVSGPGGMYCDDWVTVVVPSPPPPPPPVCSGNAALIQSTYGGQGDNFEVVVPNDPGTGIAEYWRDNSSYSSQPWNSDGVFETTAGTVGAVSLIESSYGNLEVVARIGTSLAHFYRNESTGAWYPTNTNITAGLAVSGTPSLVQEPSSGAVTGNFEVVVPLATGGMALYSRNNSSSSQPWSKVDTFGSGVVSDVSLIYSSYGNLEVVARIGTSLAHWYRYSVTGTWIEATPSITGGLAVSGTPSFVQLHSSPNVTGNFEVVAPLAIGGMALFSRDNSVSSNPWSLVDTFGSGNLLSASMIYSSYLNLEVVTHGGNGNCGMDHYWRNPPPAGQWSGPTIIVP